MNCRSQTLCSNIDVDNDTLWFTGQTSVTIGHGKCNHLGAWMQGQHLNRKNSKRALGYLIGTGNDGGELILLLLLALHHGLEDGRMVRSKIDKDMGHSGLVVVSICY